ncbi:maleylpyruvate isomerase family mycothiol-dependent enzyme [Nocardia sp. NBC_01503]|uniref:maleylpyruvate isomerase family mycothiol-dependent enzyme n=1 Tax=Nocardia sp. NBC_01503 TaxID=2975997 RepID=UPI002E7C480D|nr:maleylpyruvate isomerase family mycothiol-dependent enzyme [Nocardia sp. NBC_01503]WTL30774.1 maleylpyruvate isomerase family mycothiol-dependent enzyme [Nocardia sp. NBC_01503]
MAMTSDDIWRAVSAERVTLVELLESLSEQDWDRDSLCAEWRIRDVVAHVVLSSNPTLGSLLINLIRARGSITRFARDTGIRHAESRSSRQLLQELRATIGLRTTAPGTTPADRLMDVLVHIQDIAIPLGVRIEMPTAAARLAMERVWSTKWLFHSEQRLAGFHLTATDTDWSAGAGTLVEAPIADLLLLASGRTARLDALTGPGAAALIRKVGVS